MEGLETPYHSCRLWVQTLALFILVVLLSSVAWAQSKQPPGTGQALSQQMSDPLHINEYIAAHYSIFGPAKLLSVNSSSLVFPGAQGSQNFTISLANKNVSVKDVSGGAESFGALTAGTNVIVCQKSDSAIILIVPSHGGSSNVPK